MRTFTAVAKEQPTGSLVVLECGDTDLTLELDGGLEDARLVANVLNQHVSGYRRRLLSASQRRRRAAEQAE